MTDLRHIDAQASPRPRVPLGADRQISMSASLVATLPRDRSAARMARELIAERFTAELDQDQLFAAKLLATELINNAVVHGVGEITLEADMDDQRLRVHVIDEGTGFERQVRETGFEDVGGRGLWIVDAESSRWGVFEGTTHVWFELERSGPRLGEP